MPAGNDEVVIASGTGATVIDRACDAVAVLLSVTCTVRVALPALDGVPLMTPVVAERVRPWGKAPCEIVQVTGVAPPDCVSVAEYGLATVPVGKLVVVITGLGLIVSCRLAVSVLLSESVTMTVNENVPGTVGVPVMTPEALNERPDDSAPPAKDHW